MQCCAPKWPSEEPGQIEHVMRNANKRHMKKQNELLLPNDLCFQIHSLCTYAVRELVYADH